MSLESLEINNDIQFPQNESFNRSSTSSPANSDLPADNHNINNNNQIDTQTTTSHTKMYKCKQCVFICMNKEDYWLHQRQMHIKPEKLLECSKCPFVTEYKHHLEYHLRNHMGSKPYKCTQCEYACVNLSMLRSHSKSHSKAIQYNCAECSYSTKYYNSLKAHMDKFNHTCSTTVNSKIDPKTKTQMINQHQKTAASFSSSSSTCSSSSFDNHYISTTNQTMVNNRKSASKKIQHNDGSVNSSNSSVSSTSSSLSSSPNWTSQLNINPNHSAKQQLSSDSISPQINFNTAAALAAAAMAYQQQQPSFLMNPALLLNPHSLGSLVDQSNDTDQINTVINTLKQLNETNSDATAYNNNNNQFNLMQQQMQIQMALAMAANNPNIQQFSNIFSDIYSQQQIQQQQQQKNQQDQLLLAYLQQTNQADAFQIPTHLNLNNKRVNTDNISDTSKRQTVEQLSNDSQINSKAFKCGLCKSRFGSKKDLKKHVSLNHTKSENSDELSSPSDTTANPLYECFKCELIFRNYEMFCAHKMLHEIQEQKLTDNSKVDIDKEVSKVNAINQENAEFFNCSQCGISISNALQFYIHLQTCHQRDSNQLGGTGSSQDQLIDPVKEGR